jgi:ATPase subunit of ABC transporter with duplicated ATPase domains
MSAFVVAHGVSFEFSNGRELFKNLTFSLSSTRTALVGPNGVGKTLLARILAGEVKPTEGTVRRAASVALLPQLETPEAISVAEYLSDEYEWSLVGERLLQDIDRESPCISLSGGQWMRVRLTRALNGGYLILDEPTNDLDRDGRAAVHEFLRHHHDGVLLISHDRECLELCDEILELSNRGLMRFGGGWSDYLEAKQSERERLLASLEAAKRERDTAFAHRAEQRARQEKRNKRGAQVAARGGAPKILLGMRKRRAQASSGELDAKTMARAQAAVGSAHEALSEIKIDPVMYADLVGSDIPSQKLVAEARGFNIRFDRWLFAEDLDFALRGNVRVALKGANGAGKSTLLKAIRGIDFVTRGELRRGELTTLYLDQRRSSLDDSASIFDNVRAVASGSDSEIRNGLARFLFAGDAAFQSVASLSGGERLRAALAKGLLSTRKPELLLLDEPTNNLDLANIEFLERIVGEFRGALIVVSHDERFLANCGVTQELVLSGMRG